MLLRMDYFLLVRCVFQFYYYEKQKSIFEK